jgi:hypothetical protein
MSAEAGVGVQWWARAANVLKALAATSGIVTFLAFGWQIHREISAARAEVAQAWQESEIFGVVFECRERGVSMPVIEAELRRRVAAAAGSGGLEADAVTGPSVRRALMQLTERDIIALRPDVTYAVPLQWADTVSASAAVPSENRPYGCHCYAATPDGAEVMPPHCATQLPVASRATPNSGT